VLPKPDLPPAFTTELSGNLLISGFVSSDLWKPKILPRFWHSAMSAATMPKASVYEDGQAHFSEDKIWFTYDLLLPSPSGNAVFT
jgi:hypothetical protein